MFRLNYFAAARQAYEAVARPEVLRRVEAPVRLPAEVVEEAFLRDNAALTDAGLTVTCRDGHVHEVRVCLTRALEPRACGADIRRDCVAEVLLLPID